MSEVYTVCKGYSYEGYAPPEFVTLDYAKAVAAREELLKDTYADYIDIFVYQLDTIGDGKEMPVTPPPVEMSE